MATKTIRVESKRLRNRELRYSFAGWFCIGVSILLTYIMYRWKDPSLAEHAEIYGGLTNWANVVAPLVNLAGFFMIYVAFLQQRNSMRQSRVEFDLQQFEQTFFNMINLHHQIISGINASFQAEVGSKTENSFFVYTIDHLEELSEDVNDQNSLRNIYQDFYADQQKHIDHFVRNLLFILSIIGESLVFRNMDTEQKRVQQQHYLDILSSQLATPELALLLYDSWLRPEGKVQARLQLISKLDFFQRLQQEDALIDLTHYDQFYASVRNQQ